MEIERLVSGELTKSIEQAASLLGDLERKMAGLKSELVQAASAAGIRTPPTLGAVNPYLAGGFQGFGGPQQQFGSPSFGVSPYGVSPFGVQQPNFGVPGAGVLSPGQLGFGQQGFLPQPFGVQGFPGVQGIYGAQGVFGTQVPQVHPLVQQAWLSHLLAREALLRQNLAAQPTQGYGNIAGLGTIPPYASMSQGLTGVTPFSQGINPSQYGYIW